MRRFALAALLTGTAWPASLLASPWTLGEGTAVISSSFDQQFASSEFFTEGGSRPFPLRGRYTASSFTLRGRFGLTDRFELEASLPLKLVSYQSDPVILSSAPTADQMDLRELS